MSKNTKILLSIIIILVVVIAVTLYLNKDIVEENNKLNQNAIFIVYENGSELKSYTMDEIQHLGETNFKANLKTNGKAPIEYEYTGVLLKNILEDAGIILDNKEAVIVTAADGYSVAVEIDKVLENDNVYLAYMREGESIKSKDEGGRGPYQMIISKDQFSQFWCKYAINVDVQ